MMAKRESSDDKREPLYAGAYICGTRTEPNFCLLCQKDSFFDAIRDSSVAKCVWLDRGVSESEIRSRLE